MLCRSCGFYNPGGMRFCGECGTPFDEQSSDAGPISPVIGSAEASGADRRNLTVMFCDIAGSVTLSQELDPEDLRQVVRSYQQVCIEAVARFGGHIAQYLGDGVVVYFGYPQAHEDDAIRATHAGLDVLSGMDELNPTLFEEHGVRR